MITPSQKVFNVIENLSVKMEKDFGTNEPSFLGMILGEVMRRMVACFGLKDSMIVVNRTMDMIAAQYEAQEAQDDAQDR